MTTETLHCKDARNYVNALSIFLSSTVKLITQCSEKQQTAWVQGLADVWLQTFLSLINWVHLFATTTWIGGMVINFLVLLPSTREALDAAVMGKFLAAVMRRFRRLVYACISLLVLSGTAMTLLNKNYLGIRQYGNTWTQIILVKHLFVTTLILLAVYAFEVLAPKVAKVAAKGPSPELARLQKLQLRIAGIGLVLGLIILLLTGAATAISALA